MRGGREGKREGGRVRGVKEIKRVHVHMTEREGGKRERGGKDIPVGVSEVSLNEVLLCEACEGEEG